MDKAREKITDFVQSLLREQGHEEPLSGETSLVHSGLLDSFTVMRLVVFMEEAFGINFADEYFDQNIFDTIADMTDFITVRTGEKV